MHPMTDEDVEAILDELAPALRPGCGKTRLAYHVARGDISMDDARAFAERHDLDRQEFPAVI